jgi:NAD(P)-dependent dehydrogenase (short-subunit alcohol dehydrogenase family)
LNYLESVFSLSGKVVVVTGASGGIGQAITLCLAQAGARKVYALDLKDDTKWPSQNIENYSIDLQDENQISGFVDNINLNYPGGIDVLVNCAGVTFTNNFFDYSNEDWDTTYRINLLAPYLLSKGLAKNMFNGSVINITSLNAELAFPNNPAYVTTKHGLKGLTKTLALELGKRSIRVNNVGPGYIKTEMTKKSWSNDTIHEERKKKTFLDRWGTPTDIAGTVLFLASDASSYITGQDIYVDGGWTAKGL